MSNNPATRSREYVEGWLGRRRWYKCRSCGQKFPVDTLNPLPEADRTCRPCDNLKPHGVSPVLEYGGK